MWRKKTSKPKVKTPLSPDKALIIKQVLIGIVLCTLIGLLLWLTYYLTHRPGWQLKEIEVVGGFTIPHEIVIAAAEGELLGTYWRLIPKRFMYLYPEAAITEAVMNISRVKQVVLKVTDEKNLVIAFEEFRPLALWCSATEVGTCFFIDHTGLAFAPAPNLTGGSFVRYVTDTEPTANTHVTDRAFLDDTQVMIERLETELDLFVTHVRRPDDQDVEYVLAGGGELKLSQAIPSLYSFTNLKAILASSDFEHLEADSFQYIDLRFGDKVFVNEVKPELETGSTTPTTTSPIE